jgi:hypothetical protein
MHSTNLLAAIADLNLNMTVLGDDLQQLCLGGKKLIGSET